MSGQNPSLPEGLLVSWYGDDFTGSAAVMEVLTFAGLPSVLFLDIPTSDQLASFNNMRGIGIAGTARAQSPKWMETNLPPIFRFMQKLGAPISHYKVCSTLDSSPETGSIGKAIDIAAPIFNSKWIPLFLAAPAIRRFQAFGNLFAAAPGGVFRLDRHPVMAQHPVTPMDEADVAAHISKQTTKKIALVDLEQLQTSENSIFALDQNLCQGAEIISLDTVDQKTLTAAGRLIWPHQKKNIFAVGSQGVEYALLEYFRLTMDLPDINEPESAGPADQMIVVSGSVSETTATQIRWALDHDFVAIAFDAIAAAKGGASLKNVIEKAANAAVNAINNGRDPLVFTAIGPNDQRVKFYFDHLDQSRLSARLANQRVGEALGQVLDKVLERTGVSRAVICGGDTSGHATKQLGIFALTALAPTIPGAALCKAHSSNPALANLELALKGGQMGTRDYLTWIKQGGGFVTKQRKQP